MRACNPALLGLVPVPLTVTGRLFWGRWCRLLALPSGWRLTSLWLGTVLLDVVPVSNGGLTGSGAGDAEQKETQKAKSDTEADAEG